MAEWIVCPRCSLRHTQRADGACPRCRAAVSAAAASPAATSAAAPSAAPGPAAPGTPPPAVAPLQAQDDGFAGAVAALRTPPKRRSWIWLGLLSAAGFAVIAAWQRSVLVAVIVTAVVLLHELGHFAAMRLSGHRDARIFFVPFLGAVTTASSRPTSAMAHLIILLAGPVPGIVLGVVLLPLASQPGPLRGTAVFLLYLNVLNLLPIGFLDGGRVLSTLLLARSPKLEAAFQVVSAVPMAHLFGLGAESGGAVGGFAAGMLLTAVRGVRLGEAAAAVAPSLKGCTDLGAASDDGLRALHAAAGQVLVKDRVKKPKPAQYAKVMREVFDRATAPVATPAERLGFGFAWAAALAVGWATLASTGASLL